MKLIKNIYILFVTGFIASCTMVDFPDPVEQTPVFFAKGTIDGKAVNWTAGENGYYMHTQIRKNNRQTILEGRLAKEECLALCPQSLQLNMVLDSLTLPNSPLIFKEGTQQFFTTLERDKMQFSFTLKSESKGLPTPSKEISISGVDLSKEATAIVQKKESTFRYLIKYADYFTLLIESNVNPRIGETALPILQIDANEKRKLIAFRSEQIASVTWSVVKEDSTNSIEFSKFPESRLSAKVLFVSGSFATYTFDFGTLANVKEFTFSESIVHKITKILPAENNSQNQTMVLEYMDENGIKYTSQSIEQSNSSFQFRLSEPFDTNSSGNNTQKLNCIINCLLSNADTGKSIKVGDLEMTIALPFQ
ncbi:MAG TPA: hypothetical protein PKD18_09145 [Saprospiraceae bacterium]|nr:hypothetical protein [Saprospiraceae bacterium]